MPGSDTILCPSWRCEEGAILLGIVVGKGTVAFAKDRIVVDAAFVEAAQEAQEPEKRFRFSSACRQSGCCQWVDNQCSVIERVASRSPSVPIPSELPACTIRGQCRWFRQRGPSACGVCPAVMTDER